MQKEIQIKDLYCKIICKTNMKFDDDKTGKYPRVAWTHKNGIKVKKRDVKCMVKKIFESPQYYYIIGHKNYYQNYQDHTNWVSGYGKNRINAVENFQKLIDNFDENVMPVVECVKEGDKYVLIDGLHRCSILYNKNKNKKINIKIINDSGFINLPLKKPSLKYLKRIKNIGINTDDFCIVDELWLPILGIETKNRFLSLILKSEIVDKYKDKIESDSKLKIKTNCKDYHLFGCKDDNDLIQNYTFELYGFKICFFNFYNKIIEDQNLRNIDDIPYKIIIQNFVNNDVINYDNIKNISKENFIIT